MLASGTTTLIRASLQNILEKEEIKTKNKINFLVFVFKKLIKKVNKIRKISRNEFFIQINFK